MMFCVVIKAGGIPPAFTVHGLSDILTKYSNNGFICRRKYMSFNQWRKI